LKSKDEMLYIDPISYIFRW